MSKFVYAFNEGSKNLTELLGEKGVNLSEMTRIGLPVPFGFTVTTQACRQFILDGGIISEDICHEIFAKLEELEEVTGKQFGNRQNPLLVAVRPSAMHVDAPLPGAVLNLGLNDDIAECLKQQTGNSEFVYDCCRKLQQTYEETVGSGRVPEDPKEQLLAAIAAIFSAWNSAMNSLGSGDADAVESVAFEAAASNAAVSQTGVAVCVQAMAFGNLGEDSCIGIAHSRNPQSGEKKLCGEFWQNTQSKVPVVGSSAAKLLDQMAELFPAAFTELVRISEVLEKYFLDMQDMEFVVTCGKLCMVQTGTAKRTAAAAVKAAADMACEGLISKEMAVLRVEPGKAPDARSACSEEFEKILSWADEIRTLKIRANLDGAEDLKIAAEMGAEGIGLCRTEYILLREENMPALCQLLIAENEQQKNLAAERLFQCQKKGFKAVFKAMEDKPVAIRLMDAPLSAILPREESAAEKIAAQTGISVGRMKEAFEQFREMNPMLGHRGCRLAVTYPEIAQLQTRAIMEAAIEIQQESEIEIAPEIMVPLIGIDKEMEFVKDIVVATAQQCSEERGCAIRFYVGTMIEVPRAALIADKIAREVDFFSFGASDLTQMTFGFSRDDTEVMIAEYIRKGILTEDPFRTIDRDGIGSLMETAVKAGRQAKSTLKIGLCGEHGGDPASIAFCHQLGLNYVSCRPRLLFAARIAAAQAAIRDKK